jgi:hypothetical protein
MTARPAGVRLRGRVGVEAPPGAQADQNGGASVTQRLGELDRIVASIEEEPGQRTRSGQVRDKGRDLLGSDGIGILLGTQALHTHRCRPTLSREADLGDPGIRPARDDGLPGRMARGVIIERTPRTGFGVAARPDADVDGIERLTISQGMLGEQRLHACGTDLADRECVVEAAPATLMLRLHAQQRQRGDRSRRQQRVAQLEERVLSTHTGRVGRRAKGGQRGKLSGFHTPHSVTLRRWPEAMRGSSPGQITSSDGLPCLKCSDVAMPSASSISCDSGSVLQLWWDVGAVHTHRLEAELHIEGVAHLTR